MEERACGIRLLRLFVIWKQAQRAIKLAVIVRDNGALRA
jgi:hypothetical protein